MSYGITEDDKQKLGELLETREKHGQKRHHIHSQHVNAEHPELPTVDGGKQVAELRGTLQTRKAHRPDQERAGPYPWCADRPGGYDKGSSERVWRFRSLSMAREWREPCRICFPEGYDE